MMDNTTIAGIRLVNQQLSGTEFTTPEQVVSWMGAMQAQDFNMSKWAIGIRLPGCTDKLVMDAFNKGKLLRTHVMRPTWHFVSPEDIRWMLQLTAPRIISAMKSRDTALGITAEFYSKGFQIIQKALEDNNCLTREELTTILGAHGMVVDSSQLSHLLMRAELEALVCSGPVKGKKQTYTWLDGRVPKTPVLKKDEALAKLAGTYFTSHGPATLHDFVWWSGLSVTEARQGLDLVKPDLVSEKNGEQVYWMAHNVQTNSETLHLLPAFDEYIISYRNRLAALPVENHHRAVSSNGIFRPTVLKNGQVIGLWKKMVSKSKTIAIDLFASADRATRNSMDEAEKEFRRYLG